MPTPPVFPFRPNWRRPVLERLEWLTDVTEARDATEDRIQLRSRPRRTLEYSVLLQGHALGGLDARLWHSQAREVLVPLWVDVQTCAPVALGATVLTVETLGYDFAAGGHALLMRDAQTWELLYIDTVEPEGLILSAPTAQAWPAGTLLYPVRPGRLPDDVGALRGSAAVGQATVRFELAPGTWTAAAPATTYRDVEVSLRRPNWLQGVPHHWQRKTERIDYELGAIYVDDLSDLASTRRTHRITLAHRADIAAWRSWLYARAGRRHAFWQPLWQVDRLVTAPVSAADITLQVRALDHAQAYGQDPGRRDLAIRHRRTGQWVFRRIESASAPLDGVETLTLDAAIGLDAQPGDLFVSWLMLSRLDADAVEIAWHSAGAAVSVFDIRSVRE